MKQKTEAVKVVPAYDMKEEIVKLFSEYTDMLCKNDSNMTIYLDAQNYEQELKDLEHKYGMPDGRLYAVLADDKVAGCIALKRLDEISCEVKRLYVREEFRGRKLGQMLMEHVIQAAEKIGYSHMFLDTLPFLKSAIKLYKKCGFYETESYNGEPLGNLIYMRLDI